VLGTFASGGATADPHQNGRKTKSLEFGIKHGCLWGCSSEPRHPLLDLAEIPATTAGNIRSELSCRVAFFYTPASGMLLNAKNKV